MVRSKVAEKISAKTSSSTKKSLKKFVDELLLLNSARFKFLTLKQLGEDKKVHNFVFMYNRLKKPVRSEYNVKSDYNNDYNAWKRQLRTVEFIDKNEERKVWNYFLKLNNNSIEKTWSALEKGIEIKGDLITIEKFLLRNKDTKEPFSSFKAYFNTPFIKPENEIVNISKNKISDVNNLRLTILDELNKFTNLKDTINLRRKDFHDFSKHLSDKINTH